MGEPSDEFRNLADWPPNDQNEGLVRQLQQEIAAWRQWRASLPPGDYPPCPGEVQLQTEKNP